MTADLVKHNYVVEVLLSAAELSYLLQTLGAKTLWGGDATPLFPPAAEQNDAQLAQGLAELKAHGWLSPARDSKPTAERWVMDHNLIQMAAVIADPEVVIVTTRYPTPQRKEVACHYLTTTTIIELMATAVGTYRLLALPTYALLWERLGEALAIPTNGLEDIESYSIDETIFSKIVQQVAVHKAGTVVDPPTALEPALAPLWAILTATQPLGEIEIGRVAGEQLLTGQNFTFLVESNRVWLLTYRSESTIVIEPVTQQMVIARLQAYLREWLGVSVENRS